MAPDLNSLPPSTTDLPTSPSSRLANLITNMDHPATPGRTRHGSSSGGGDVSPSPSPRSASISLQATATLNAGLQRVEPARRSSSSSISRHFQSPISTGRRRSQVLMNLQLADPTVPAPGEMVSDPHAAASGSQSNSPVPFLPTRSPTLNTADPHHARTPSLGELHQSLENEQEFQVNRLLQEIRRLQAQLASASQAGQNGSQSAVEDQAVRPAPTTVASPSIYGPFQIGSIPRSPVMTHPRSSFDMARADLQRRSRTPSRGASPRLRSTSFSTESGDPMALGGRDESAFYQAETQMLIRENQMLKHRIRELERQLSEATGTTVPHEPSHASHLMRSTSASEDDPLSRPNPMASLPEVTDGSKEE